MVNIKRRENVSAILLYLLLLALFYSPVLFSGKTLQPSLYQPNGVVEGWPWGYKGRVPENLFNIDLATPAYYEWPVNKLVGDIYRNGELPLWNPYQGAGTPLAAQYSTRAFFPYQVLEDLSPVWLWDYFILGRLLIAGFFTFLFLRSLNLPFAAAFLAGSLYMFSGSFTWFINLEEYANNAMMLPVFIYSLERLFSRGGGREVAISAMTFALVILAGQPEVALYVLFLGSAYYLFRVLSQREGALKGIKRFAAVSIIGLALSAPLTIPFLELMKNSYHIHPSGGQMGTKTIEKRTRVAGIFTPTAFEFPQEPLFVPSQPLAKGKTPAGEGFYFRFFPTNGEWDYIGGYTGIIPLFLMLSGIFTVFLRGGPAPERRVLFFFSSFGVFMVLKNIGVEPFVRLGELPFFDQVWSQRWSGPVWTFSFAVSAAAGFQIIRDSFRPASKEGPPPSFAGRGYIPFAASAFMLLALYFYFRPLRIVSIYLKFANYNRFFFYLGPSFVLGFFLTLIFLFLALGVCVAHARKGRGIEAVIPLVLLELWFGAPRGYSAQWLYLKAFPVVIGLFTVFYILKGKNRLAIAGVLAFFASFTLIDLASPRGFPERHDPFTEAPYVRYLKGLGGHERVISGHGILFPNFASAVGLQDVRYINSLSVDSYQHFRNRHLHTFPLIEGESSSLWFTGRPELFVDLGENNIYFKRDIEKDILRNIQNYSLLGVRYIILPKGHDINADARMLSRFVDEVPPEFPLLYDREVRVFENPLSLPRVFLASGVEYAKDHREAQGLISALGPRLKASVVLEKPAPLWFRPGAAGAAETAKIVDYALTRVAVEVEAPSPGVLVLTDTYYPGWKATVDGKKAEVYRTYGLFRGVFVDRGRHEVVFSYLPGSFLLGSGLAAAGLIACAVLALKPRDF